MISLVRDSIPQSHSQTRVREEKSERQGGTKVGVPSSVWGPLICSANQPDDDAKATFSPPDPSPARCVGPMFARFDDLPSTEASQHSHEKSVSKPRPDPGRAIQPRLEIRPADAPTVISGLTACRCKGGRTVSSRSSNDPQPAEQYMLALTLTSIPGYSCDLSRVREWRHDACWRAPIRKV